MKIIVDDLTHPDVQALLTQHLLDMHEHSPPESVHALDLEQLRQPELTFWTAWDSSTLLGCGALKALDTRHGEIKSMRTAADQRRRGTGRAMLDHIIVVARSRGYTRLSLETGTADAFLPAQRLYERAGFQYSGPFGDYLEDPYSTFMTLDLTGAPLP